jgi:hypothetical protein
MAAALETAGFPAEAKAVLEEGATARMIDTAKGRAKDILTRSNARAAQEKAGLTALQTRAMADAGGALALKTGDTLLGRGDYAKAADLYRAAIQKGSVDGGLASARLGMALALAGQTAEAQVALRAVTGPHAPIAAYWLAWLGQRS